MREIVVSPAAPQFMFDFGSPNAFLSHEAIPAIEQRTGAKFEYVPILLGGIFKATNNKSPAETLAGIKNKREFHELETERFVKRFGVKPYTMNPFFPVNTLNLMRAAVAAQLEGVFEKYVDAAFHHMWVEPKKMDDMEVAAKALTADREYATGGRARRVRFTNLLRRQGNVLRQGAVARGRGNGFGEVTVNPHGGEPRVLRGVSNHEAGSVAHPSRRGENAAPRDEGLREILEWKSATRPVP
jgi:2-hydroxychromene-2-carboxylate isomerase